MFNSPAMNRRNSIDATSSRRGRARSRKLSLEPMESRLLLAGDLGSTLDASIWNLDADRNSYVVIPAENVVAPHNQPDDVAGRDRSVTVPPPASIADRPDITLFFGDSGTQFVDAIGSGGALSSFSYSSDLSAADLTQWHTIIQSAANDQGLVGLEVSWDGQTRLLELPLLAGGVDDYLIRLSSSPAGLSGMSENSSTGLFPALDAWRSGSSITIKLLTLDSHAFGPGGTSALRPMVDASPFGGDSALDGPAVADIEFGIEPVASDSRGGPSEMSRPVEPAAQSLNLDPLPSGSGRTKLAIDLADVIDELLDEDVLIADANGKPRSGNSDGRDTQLTSAGGSQPSGAAVDGGVDAEPVAAVPAEGGMVPVEQIVSIVSTPATPVITPLAADGDSATIVGDLARVAVMELIEGESDPAAPDAGGDHVALLAGSDAIKAAEQMVHRSAVMALVMPTGASHLAALASQVGDVFSAFVLGDQALPENADLSAEAAMADSARLEAFAHWDADDAAERVVDDEGFDSWLDVTPLAALLAFDQVMSFNSRRRRDPARTTAQPRPQKDAC